MSKEQNAIREETDRRLLENKLLRGQISEKQLAKYLETLPDVSENAEEVVIAREERK
ncbi:MAG: hypothetical protein V1766_12435 [Pseudomonadota bacterium]